MTPSTALRGFMSPSTSLLASARQARPPIGAATTAAMMRALTPAFAGTSLSCNNNTSRSTGGSVRSLHSTPSLQKFEKNKAGAKGAAANKAAKKGGKGPSKQVNMNPMYLAKMGKLGLLNLKGGKDKEQTEEMKKLDVFRKAIRLVDRAPPPLRMGRNRHLRHWTIHRAWLLLRRQRRELQKTILMRQWTSMREACEELRNTAGPGLRDEGYLYRVAMEKKGVWHSTGIPIEYARPQTETPARDAWNHDWKR